MKIYDFLNMKVAKKKISMITCYDYWSAKIVEKSDIDCVLVGDSLSMVMHGENSTVNASIELMAHHIRAVSKGLNDKFIIGDLPFLSYRKSLSENMNAVETLMKAGANAVKLEGAEGNLDFICHLVESGIPVMGHLGLTPQFVNLFGGFKVQGKTKEAAELILKQAKGLESAGCFSVVLEAVPESLSEVVTNALHIPTIGIGAGNQTDGQVLVLQDMLGMNDEFKPKFLKEYLNGHDLILNALNDYNSEVKSLEFPNKSHVYEADGGVYGH